MAILDNAFPESPDFHDFTEEKFQNDIKDFILSPTMDIPLEIYDYVSPLRRLLFEWYPFKEGCRVLEIGGNVGEHSDSMVCNSSLWIVISSYFFTSISGTHLCSSFVCNFAILLFFFNLI